MVGQFEFPRRVGANAQRPSVDAQDRLLMHRLSVARTSQRPPRANRMFRSRSDDDFPRLARVQEKKLPAARGHIAPEDIRLNPTEERLAGFQPELDYTNIPPADLPPPHRSHGDDIAGMSVVIPAHQPLAGCRPEADRAVILPADHPLAH